ncbi:putative AMP-binding enzyme [Lyophyllum shimeji]|uniref:AMP-binding enzyme n=1 Tax=Lyophyllum shimeji TaxID=47721 RepID=A0A9P3PUA4_LYOSH|nr:putative AMP-binding enzyme [Lyophyllum shimeji]
MHFMHDLLESLAKHSNRPLFKRYTGSIAGSTTVPSWTSISYGTYLNDLNNAAAYWKCHLDRLGVQENEVVGIWVTGLHYADLVHLYALIRAGFIPQVFNLAMLSKGPMINELLHVRAGKAFIYDKYYAAEVQHVRVPTAVIPELSSIPVTPPSQLGSLPQAQDEDVAVIFHTTGTTSGRPKSVPQTHKWLKCQSQVNWPGAWQGGDGSQKCFNNLGSFGSVGSATAINYLSPTGQCLIQTSKPDFDADEFLAMVRKEGLNNMLLFASWFSKLLKVARTSPEVLEALRSMQQISYTGEALNPDDARWVVEQGIPVAVIYATTETAICMVSDLKDPGNLPSMRLIEGMNCKLLLRRISASSEAAEDPGHDEHLFDFFVPEDAGNCPHSSVRNRPDGHITGDLFEETRPGYYIFRGRSDDWIRTGHGRLGFCDTKAIEDNVKLTCSDLVQNCVVVGNAKPVVLFVEPASAFAESVRNPIELKAEILKRLGPFEASLYAHERIEGRVVIVPPGSLPRTKEKGNIRRKAVEEDFAGILEEIYS